ncbi:hypothetical protein Gohar_004456, partial [Gossypium harknessii]|nr:hypothetical protein [Gossypium harknessii]
MEERQDTDMRIMTDEINELLEKLKFSEEKTTWVVSTCEGSNPRRFESWAIGKIMAIEQPDKEAMYRVFKVLWFTKEEVDFVALKEGFVIVKFGCMEDRSRILNLSPWLFDRCLFSMVPFERGKEMDSYEFWMSPFWLRVYNIPIELMDRRLALDIGNVIGELVAIDWKDRNGGWTEFMRLKIKINVLRPLRRIVKLVDKNGVETIGMLKYERLLDFCYECEIIGHMVKKCSLIKEDDRLNGQRPQFGCWMRAPTETQNLDRALGRNGVELFMAKTKMSVEKNESHTNSGGDSEQTAHKGKEKGGEEGSISNSPLERKYHRATRVGMGSFESKRKRQRGPNGENTLEKMEYVRVKLGPWQYHRYRNMKTRIKELEKEISRLMDGPTSDQST